MTGSGMPKVGAPLLRLIDDRKLPSTNGAPLRTSWVKAPTIIASAIGLYLGVIFQPGTSLDSEVRDQIGAEYQATAEASREAIVAVHSRSSSAKRVDEANESPAKTTTTADTATAP